ANTVKTTTTPTPTRRAVALPAVRRGLRRAFSRAMAPVTPRNRAAGQPRTATAGPATPATTTATPRAPSTAPATARARDVPLWPTATSRRAASGLTRDARIAGARPAATVVARPATKATTRLVVLTLSPAAGRANPA